MKRDLIVGLDFGSAEIKLVIGEVVVNDFGQQLRIIGALSEPSGGVKRGLVDNIEEATSALSAILEKAERLIGDQLNNVFLGVNTPFIKEDKHKSAVMISRHDGEITDNDLERSKDAVATMAFINNYDVLDILPLKYLIDGQDCGQNPVGMTGMRLEAEYLVLQHPINQLRNWSRVLGNRGLDFSLLLSGLAAETAVLDAQQKDLGVVLINLGATTTSLTVFESGSLMHTAVLPIGAKHITADIAIGLKCTTFLAEKIKIRYGSAKAESFNKKDELDISDLLAEEKISDESSVISRHYIAEIIEARAEEIMTKIDEELRKIDRSGLLPGGAVLIGGGAKLTDILSVAKRKLRLPASLGENKARLASLDKVNDPKFLPALGLLTRGQQFEHNSGGGGKLNFGVAKDWFKKALNSLRP